MLNDAKRGKVSQISCKNLPDGPLIRGARHQPQYGPVVVVGAFYLQNTTFVFFHGLLALGYGAIFYFSVKHLRLVS